MGVVTDFPALTWLLCAASLLVYAPSARERVSARIVHRQWAPHFARSPTGVPVTSGDIDLFAACLRAGLSPAQAAAAVGGPGWSTVANLLASGIPVARAWSAVSDRSPEASPWRALTGLAVSADHTGASVAAECFRVAAGERERVRAQRTATAERAGVLIALPLTLCFLPAFLLVGLVPVLITMGAAMF